MTESIVWEDYLTVGLYFAVVLAVGLWVTCLSRGIADNVTNSLELYFYVHPPNVLSYQVMYVFTGRVGLNSILFDQSLLHEYNIIEVGRVRNSVDPDQMDQVF